ncbi:MAG: nitrile hydratase subunit beta, partial [Chloroflexota bacterium]
MNGVHDMGGMHGFGPIPREENEPVFHQPWEGRAYALNATGNVRWFESTSGFRFAKESLPPGFYLNAGYYERWLAVVERRMVELGLASQGEIEAGSFQRPGQLPK